MPRVDGCDQYAGLAQAHRGGRKYSTMPYMQQGCNRIRLLSPTEIEEFQQFVQRVRDGARPSVPVLRKAIV
jgi:hypothetical protein